MVASVSGQRASNAIDLRGRRSFFLVFLLDNVGPDTLNDVRVQVTLPNSADRAMAIEGRASSPNANPSSVADTALVQLGRSACLRYLQGSTSLGRTNDAQSGGFTIRSLDDGVVDTGVIADRIPVLNDGRFYVRFKVGVHAPASGVMCE